MLQGGPVQQLSAGQVLIQAPTATTTINMPQEVQQGASIQVQLQPQHWSQSTVMDGSWPSLPPGYHVIAVPKGFQSQQQVLMLQPAQGMSGQQLATFTSPSAPTILQQVQGPQLLQLQPQVQVVQFASTPLSSQAPEPADGKAHHEQAQVQLVLQQVVSQPASALSDKTQAVAAHASDLAVTPAAREMSAPCDVTATSSDRGSCGAAAGPSSMASEQGAEQARPCAAGAAEAETSQSVSQTGPDAVAAADGKQGMATANKHVQHAAEAGAAKRTGRASSSAADAPTTCAAPAVSNMSGGGMPFAASPAFVQVAQVGSQNCSASAQGSGRSAGQFLPLVELPPNVVPVGAGAQSAAVLGREVWLKQVSGTAPAAVRLQQQQVPRQLQGMTGQTLMLGGQQVFLAPQPTCVQVSSQQQLQGFSRVDAPVIIQGPSSGAMGQASYTASPAQTVLTSNTGQTFVLVQGTHGQQVLQQVQPQHQQVCMQILSSMMGQCSVVLAPAQGQWR